jgi:hypothetical protein
MLLAGSLHAVAGWIPFSLRPLAAAMKPLAAAGVALMSGGVLIAEILRRQPPAFIQIAAADSEFASRRQLLDAHVRGRAARHAA